MKRSDAAFQIRSLRVQLDVLEARLRFDTPESTHSLAGLRGFLIAEEPTTDTELEAAKYQGIDQDMS